MTLEETSPTLFGLGYKESDLDKIEISSENSSSSTIILTKDKADLVFTLLPDLEKFGYVNIAQEAGLTKEQVEIIHQEVLAYKSSKIIIGEIE